MGGPASAAAARDDAARRPRRPGRRPRWRGSGPGGPRGGPGGGPRRLRAAWLRRSEARGPAGAGGPGRRRRPALRPAARVPTGGRAARRCARRAGTARWPGRPGGQYRPGGPHRPGRPERPELDRGAASASGRAAPAAQRREQRPPDAGPPGARPPGDAPARHAPAGREQPGPEGFGTRPRFAGPPDRGPRPYGRPGGPGTGFGRRDGPPASPGHRGAAARGGRGARRRPATGGGGVRRRPARSPAARHAARRQALERIVLHATTLRIPIVEVEGGSLTVARRVRRPPGRGVVVDARRFASVDDLLARAIERGEPALALVLDSLEDPRTSARSCGPPRPPGCTGSSSRRSARRRSRPPR